MLCCVVSVLLCYVMVCYVTLRYVMLCCYVTLRYVMLCYVTLRYVVLCYVIFNAEASSTRCRWTSSRVCRSHPVVIRCDSQL